MEEGEEKPVMSRSLVGREDAMRFESAIESLRYEDVVDGEDEGKAEEELRC